MCIQDGRRSSADTRKSFDAKVPAKEEKKTYASAPKWFQKLDLAAWGAEVRALEKELREGVSADDNKHLRKMISWQAACAWVGFALAFVPGYAAVSVLAVVLMSTGTHARWTMIGHHSCHGGYDKVKGAEHHKRNKFAFGSWRRALDWMDWMLPEAWDVEHNHLHHYALGEEGDPDLVERNIKIIRGEEGVHLPMFIRYIATTFLMLTWKWLYYAPNTTKQLANARHSVAEKRAKRNGEPAPEAAFAQDEQPFMLFHTLVGYKEGGEGKAPSVWISPSLGAAAHVARAMAPYFVYRFVLAPAACFALASHTGNALFATVGWTLVANLVCADLLTNFHAFLVIATNHCGDDVYRFATHVTANSDEFYMRAVIGSVNFDLGTDAIDFFHGWLNYQIEHHVWPNMSMLQYQKAAPKLQEICDRHGVPYVKENVFKRLGKTVDIMVGNTSMKLFERGD